MNGRSSLCHSSGSRNPEVVRYRCWQTPSSARKRRTRACDGTRRDCFGTSFLGTTEISKPLYFLAIIIATTLLVGTAFGESSLSARGYGLLRESSSARAAGMGGVALAVPDTLGLNLLFPALWQGSSTTRFSLHGGYISTTTSDRYGSDVSDVAELGGLAVTIPIRQDWFFGVTLTPYTRMDYRWETSESTDWSSTNEIYHGRGGISQGLVGLSFPVGERNRFGVVGRALFGELEQKWSVSYTDVEANTSNIEIKDRLKGIGWGLSWNWIAPRDETILRGWSVGAYLFGPAELNVVQHRLITSKRILSGRVVAIDTLENAKNDLDENYDLPWDFGLGVSRSMGRHITAVEMAYHGWGQLSQPSEMVEQLRDAYRFSAGWEWDPEYRPFDVTWKALAYRAGAYWQQQYALSLTGHQTQQFGLTGGISIPYNNNLSRVNLALEIAWMGSQDQDGASERMIRFTLGINHKEQWFIGRKERQLPN